MSKKTELEEVIDKMNQSMDSLLEKVDEIYELISK